MIMKIFRSLVSKRVPRLDRIQSSWKHLLNITPAGFANSPCHNLTMVIARTFQFSQTSWPILPTTVRNQHRHRPCALRWPKICEKLHGIRSKSTARDCQHRNWTFPLRGDLAVVGCHRHRQETNLSSAQAGSHPFWPHGLV